LCALSHFKDKTFGLKNKKGGKAQKYIQQVNKSHAGNQKKVSGLIHQLITKIITNFD